MFLFSARYVQEELASWPGSWAVDPASLRCHPGVLLQLPSLDRKRNHCLQEVMLEGGAPGPGSWCCPPSGAMVSFLNVNHDHVLPPNCYQDIKKMLTPACLLCFNTQCVIQALGLTRMLASVIPVSVIFRSPVPIFFFFQ